MPKSPKWSRPFRFPQYDFMCIYHVPMRATCLARYSFITDTSDCYRWCRG
jgi:hypothetical protein